MNFLFDGFSVGLVVNRIGLVRSGPFCCGSNMYSMCFAYPYPLSVFGIPIRHYVPDLICLVRLCQV